MSDPRPILFLDVDGVLNRWDGEGRRHPSGWCTLDPAMVARVNLLVQQTGAEVVCSSSWRNRPVDDGDTPLARLDRVFTLNGATWPLAGVTPYESNCQHEKFLTFEALAGGGRPAAHCPWNRQCLRGAEIWRYLVEHGCLDRPVAILDDSSDMALMMPWLVRTQNRRGIEDRHVKQARELVEFQQWLPAARPGACLAYALAREGK